MILCYVTGLAPLTGQSAQLREALEQRGLDTRGLKAQLVERLTEARIGGGSSSGSDIDQ